MLFMQKNGTLKIIIFFTCMAVLLFWSIRLKAQPDYDFTNSIQVSGTGNASNVQIGDVYRFLNVKPNVDALVTITDITGGITVSALDAGSGYPEALQPTLEVPPMTSGYLEMSFTFIDHTTDAPLIMLEVPVTAIDVDGMKDNDGLGNPLYEYDQIDLGGGYVDYDLLGNELTISQTGTWFNGRNIGGIDYPGRDTSAKQVMFTVVNANVQSFVIRVGADNQSTKAATRLRSDYFKKFKYADGLLATSPLQSFTGAVKQDGANIQWSFQPNFQMKSVVLERSYDGQQFVPIFHETDLPANYYVDGAQSAGMAYYRLKWTSSTGETGYSKTVFLKLAARTLVTDGFKLYPNLVTDRTILSMTSENEANGTLQIFDLDGKMQQQVNLKLNQGQNSISIDGMDRLSPGGYVAVLRTGRSTFTQRLIKQP